MVDWRDMSTTPKMLISENSKLSQHLSAEGISNLIIHLIPMIESSDHEAHSAIRFSVSASNDCCLIQSSAAFASFCLHSSTTSISAS